MKYVIQKEVFERFPNAVVVVLPFRGVNNTGLNQEILGLLKLSEQQVIERFKGSVISECPQIRVWREAYSAFGAKPKKYHCSIEAMVKRIMNGGEIPNINNMVNLYNYISLKHLVSVGGDDADKIEGNVHLTLAKGDEKFQEMGLIKTTNPHVGEAIFKDDNEVLCRRWNWHQCEKTKITEESKNINLQIEGVGPNSKGETMKVAGELLQLLKKHFNAESELHVVDEKNLSVEI